MTVASREPRRFNGAQRIALYLAADGRCMKCGTELGSDWHADHIHPWSQGGPTDVTNGQALCASCNLKKGKNLNTDRYAWQQEARRDFRLSHKTDFLVTATPAAGKTRMALGAATDLRHAGEVERAIIAVPTDHLRRQWAEAALRHAGLNLNHGFASKHGGIAPDTDGIVVTYQSVGKRPDVYRKLAAEKRTLVILDEVHHAGESLAWGDGVREAFEPAVCRLLLSGTPIRSDNNPIPFVEYSLLDKNGNLYEDGKPRGVADYAYGYGRALIDRVVRPIAFPALNGVGHWREAGEMKTGRISDSGDAGRQALRAALDPSGSWMGSVLSAADTELSRVRTCMPDAGGLVIAAGQRQARAYAEMLERLTGEEPTIAISDEPDASERIEKFKNERSRWIVAVQMVSEGVDIPRLGVGVYASDIMTELFFRQVVGRFVRTRSDDDDLCATLFIPSVDELLGFARVIEKERDHALDEAIEREARKRERGPGDGQGTFDFFEPVDSSEATHHETVHGGHGFADEALAHAEQIIRDEALSASICAAQVAKILRKYGSSPQPATSAEPSEPVRTQQDEKMAIRRLINKKVGSFAWMSGGDHSEIHHTLNQMFGEPNIDHATVETLNKRLTVLDEWMGRA